MVKGGVIVSLSAKKSRRKKRVKVSNKKQSGNGSAPNLSPQQISLIAALLAGFFNIQSVIYNRDNVLQVILTTNRLTNLPILGPPTNVQNLDVQDSVDIDVINNEIKLLR